MESNRRLVHFFHGKESGPWGIKIQQLAKVAEALGYQVESLDYSGIESPRQRLEKFMQHQSMVNNLILVGSSMGGYVATLAAVEYAPVGLFLMAPAFDMPGYESEGLKPNATHTAIVHGWRDEIIPAQNSIGFAAQHKLELHLIDGDHRLNDQIDLIEKIFELFLRRVGGEIESGLA
jgi:predicted alpha/beta-hydrolase family hydrolase